MPPDPPDDEPPEEPEPEPLLPLLPEFPELVESPPVEGSSGSVVEGVSFFSSSDFSPSAETDAPEEPDP